MNNTTLAQLLHEADALSTQFNSHHASSFQAVQSVSGAYTQMQNLMHLPSTPSTRNRPEGGMRERGLVKVQQTIEEALQEVRDRLANMEQDVESIGQLLYRADLFLAQSQTGLQYGLNPLEALNHVSGLYSDYQSELIRLREVLADFTCESMDANTFVEEWRVMKEVDKGKEEELDDLIDVLNSWGGLGSGNQDVQMQM